jgi:hypothetical protein
VGADLHFADLIATAGKVFLAVAALGRGHELPPVPQRVRFVSLSSPLGPNGFRLD